MPSSRLSIRLPKGQPKSRRSLDNIESSLLGMKPDLKQKISIVLTGALLILAPASSVLAGNPAKPYLKAFGADVMSGGWYASGNSCSTDPSSNYQGPGFSSPGNPADNRNGGLLTYANKQDGGGNATGGASSQYGAFATGLIEGSDSSLFGFYSDGAQSANGPTSKIMLSFANSDSSGAPWGGLFEGSVPQSNCIPDYYGKKPSTAVATANLEAAITAGSNAYTINSGAGSVFNLTNANDQIPAGAHITIYVNGNVYIGNNITYGLDTANDIPKFALVVQGSLYIGPGVTQLDGLYIAQPATNTSSTVGADDGDIWTCHDNTTNQVVYSFPTFVANCSKKLTINGALIGKQVNFMRVNGDAATASTSEDNLNNAASSNNIGEVINYTPEMVMGGAFFNQPTSGNLPIDSLISLPPVF